MRPRVQTLVIVRDKRVDVFVQKNIVHQVFVSVVCAEVSVAELQLLSSASVCEKVAVITLIAGVCGSCFRQKITHYFNLLLSRGVLVLLGLFVFGCSGVTL